MKNVIALIIHEIAFYEQVIGLDSASKTQKLHCKLMAIDLYCELIGLDIELPDALMMVDKVKSSSPLQNIALPRLIIHTGVSQ